LLTAGLSVLPLQAVEAEQTVTTLSLKDLRAEHQYLLDELNGKHTDGKVLELDDERVPGLVRKGWELAGVWAASYLEAHPTASRRELLRIFEDFAMRPRGVKSQYGDFLVYSEYSLAGSAIRIGPSLYVVEASYGVDFRTGTFMVVARSHRGHLEALWNIKDLAEKHYVQQDEIGRWMHLVRRAYYNGPLTVAKVVPLSRAANNHVRFLVDAYQGADGGTILAQLSIWEWDGAKAHPLLVELYQYAADFGGFRLDGRTLQISTKEQLESMISCGMCPEPRGVWILRITPAEVANLGHRFLQPELQWADELLSMIDNGEDATHLADGKVIDALKARIRERDGARNPVRQPDETGFSWGMLDECRVLSRGQRGMFVLVVDESRLQFTYELREGRSYFTGVEIR